MVHFERDSDTASHSSVFADDRHTRKDALVLHALLDCDRNFLQLGDLGGIAELEHDLSASRKCRRVKFKS